MKIRWLMIVALILVMNGVASAEYDYEWFPMCDQDDGRVWIVESTKENTTILLAGGSFGLTYHLFATRDEGIAFSQTGKDWTWPCQNSGSYTLGAGTQLAAAGKRCEDEGGFDYMYHVFAYVDTATLEDTPCVVDGDNDGIDDAYDPYPGDSSDFSFEIIATQKDENGDNTYFCIKTDRGDLFCFGDKDPDEYLWIELGVGATYGGSQLETMMTGEALVTEELTGDMPSMGSVAVTDYTDQDALAMDSGTAAAGGTDNELLTKIVDNTKTISDNQNELGTYLNDLRNNGGEINSLLEKMIAANELAAGENSVVNVEVDASELADKIPDDYTGVGTSESDWGTGAYENLDTGMDQEGMPDGDLEGEIYTEESWFTGFLNSNPYKTALDNSGVTAVNQVCTSTLTVMGKDHVMDLCGLATPLQLAGNVLLAVVTLMSMLTIVRGW